MQILLNIIQQIKFVYKFTLILLIRKKKIIIPVAIFLAIIFLAVGYIPKVNLNKQITQGIVGTYTDQDVPIYVNNLLSRGLVKLDQKGNFVSDLADKWEVKNDSKEYIFTLRDNLFWSDGSKLDAKDIDFKLEDVQIEINNPKTITFKLKDSFSPFPVILSEPVFKKNYSKKYEDKFIGTGPFRIVKVKYDQIFIKQIQLKSIDNNFSNLTVKFYASEKIAKNALKLGEIQSLMGISDSIEFENKKLLSIWTKQNLSQLVTIFYNTRDPILSDENFRQALSFASPTISNELEAKTSIPTSSWAYSAGTKDYLDNPEAAKSVLNKVQKGKNEEITLTATTFLQDVGQKVLESWKKAGIKAKLQVESGLPQNYQALLVVQNIPRDPDQYSLWHSTQTQTNISKYSSPRLDKDLEDARKISDQKVRLEKYKDFQKVLLDHSPATFLYFPKYKVVYMKKIDSKVRNILDLQLRHI